MSQTALLTAFAVFGGLFFMISVYSYAQDENVTSMGNVTNMENATNGTAWIGNATNGTAMGNTTTMSSELDQIDGIAGIKLGDGG